MSVRVHVLRRGGALLGLRWVRFGLVGACATASYAGLGLLFVDVIGLPVLAGNGLAYALSFIVSYLGQSVWTFGATGGHARVLPRFALAQGIGLVLNSAIVWLCMALGLSYPLSMFLAIFMVPVFVYLLCKYWVFPGPAGGEGGSCA